MNFKKYFEENKSTVIFAIIAVVVVIGLIQEFA
jgi:hypothetical protein